VQATSDDPLARVFELESRSFKRGLAFGLAGALLVHGAGASEAARLANGMGEWAREARADIHEYLARLYDIELVNAPLPPPPPPPAETAPEPKAPPPQAARPAPHDEPRAAPAQAGKILTQEPTPDEPVDLTGMGFVTGTAETYAGGVTSRAGTSPTAVRNLNAGPGGVPGGTGSAAAPPPKQNLSRAAGPGTGEWDCRFPPEADTDQIDSERVPIVVTVAPDGTPRDVKVLKDPGHGFGRAARQCALAQRLTPALDSEGRPVLSTTPAFYVRFTR
jgi:protein TonB